MRLMDTDVIDDHDDMMDADEDDDVASSLGSSSIKDEIDGIDSVDSSYFNKRLSDLEPPQGPPVKQDSQYSSGVYRRRGTLGVDSSEVQGQPQPSQTIDDGSRGHSRQKRQTTTTMRTNSVPVVGSTASPHAHAPQSQGQENTEDGERSKNTSSLWVVGPDGGGVGFPGPTTTAFPDEGVASFGPDHRYPVEPPGRPPGGRGSSSEEEPYNSQGPGASPGLMPQAPDNPPRPNIEGAGDGGGGKNWDSDKSGTSSTY